MILLLSPTNATHVFVAAIVAFVWFLFSIGFARDRKETLKAVTSSEIGFKEKLSIFSKSDLSVSGLMLVIFLVIVLGYYIF